MSHATMVAPASPRVPAVRLAASRPRRQRPPSKAPNKDQNRNLSQNPALGFGIKKKNPVWQCVQNCGACCKLDKGPAFPYPEEIFEDPSDVELYKSLIGPDGWCIHYEKSTRKCSIYADRPYFCRVEPGIFEELYGIDKKKFHKEACSQFSVHQPPRMESADEMVTRKCDAVYLNPNSRHSFNELNNF